LLLYGAEVKTKFFLSGGNERNVEAAGLPRTAGSFFKNFGLANLSFGEI
jgi:hypothetical protein